MMKYVADEDGLCTAALEPEHDMAGGVAGCRQDFEKIVQAMRSSDKVGTPALNDWQHAFAEGAELDRLGLVRIRIELLIILKVRLGDDVAGVRKRRHPGAVA